MTVQEVIQFNRQTIKETEARIIWMEQNEDKLNALPGLSLSHSSIDFDNLPHDQVMKVILAFPGKWEKAPGFTDATKINYTMKLECGITLRCWNGFPPESCRIEEIEEEVPAKPAHKTIVRKLVCV